MKIKTRKLIAAITATALLGSALGVGTYAITKSNNDFGFKGTYDLNAFAATADAQTKTVMGKDIDTTTALCLTSDIDNNGTVDYTLFVSIVDTADMSALSNIKVGYSIGDKYYNGTTEGLSNVVYSSLTVNSTEGGTATVTAAELATNYTKITSPKLIIAEVPGPAEGAGIEITGEKKPTTEAPGVTMKTYSKDFAEGLTSSYFKISGNTTSASYTYGDKTYSTALKIETSTSIEFNLTESGTLTLVLLHKTTGTEPNIKIDGTKYTAEKGVYDVLSVELEAGGHEITKADSGNLFLIKVETTGEVNTDIPVTYTEVKEVPATCLKVGTAAYWLGSDGNKYSKSGDTYTLIEDESKLVLAQLNHTYSEEWSSNADGHYHECDMCGNPDSVIEHTYAEGTTICTICNYDSSKTPETSTVTYTYTYGSTSNVGTWTITSKQNTIVTSKDNKKAYKLRCDDGDKLTLSNFGDGKKMTIEITGFTDGSSDPQPYFDVIAYNGTTEVGKIVGTTPTGKNSGSITFTTNVIEANFTSIVIKCNTAKKAISILSASIIVES